MTNSFATLTHPGLRRRKNEDAVLARNRDGLLLLAVADGVGGERGGEVASAEAIRAVETAFHEMEGAADPLQWLTTAIDAANTAVLRRAKEDRRYRRMATTLVAAVARGATVWLGNVGDSRGYIVDAAKIVQITRDHSLVAEGIEAGTLSPDDARTSSVRNVITRSVGSAREIECDLFGPLELTPGQTVVLCSDGLSDPVDEIRIRDIVVGEAALVGAASALVAAANDKGGPDNITVALYRPEATPPSDPHPR